MGQLRVRILSFVSKHAHNRLEVTRLTVYLVFSLSGIVGLPFHFLFDWVGGGQVVLHLITITVSHSSNTIHALY